MVSSNRVYGNVRYIQTLLLNVATLELQKKKWTTDYSWTNQWHYDKLVRYSRICPVKLPLFPDEIYNGFWGLESLRREDAKVASHVIRRYQISNKGKLNISAVKCMWNLVIILLIKIVGDKEWRSCIGMDILRREDLRVIRIMK